MGKVFVSRLFPLNFLATFYSIILLIPICNSNFKITSPPTGITYRLNISPSYSSTCLIAILNLDDEAKPPDISVTSPVVQGTLDFFQDAYNLQIKRDLDLLRKPSNCYILILVEPTLSQIYSELLGFSRIYGWRESTTIIALLPKGSTWIFTLRDETNRIMIASDMYSSTIYFVTSSNLFFFYCNFCPGDESPILKLPPENSPGFQLTPEVAELYSSMTSSFYSSTVYVLGKCFTSHYDADKMCLIHRQTILHLSTKYNFTPKYIKLFAEYRAECANFKCSLNSMISEPFFNDYGPGVDVTFFELQQVIFGAFYCMKKMILEDSVVTWRKWTSPFTSPVWLSLFGICICFVIVHASSFRSRRKFSSETLFTVFTLLLRQSPPNTAGSDRPAIILPLQVLFSFLVILVMNLYEGFMTTNISVPLPPKDFQNLGQLLDAGYKFGFPTDNITEYYVRSNWSEFVFGFSKANQFWRYNTSFIAMGRTGSFHSTVKENILTATDMPYDVAWMTAYFLQPKYCVMVKEPYFTRIFKFRFARRMAGQFSREMVKLRQTGLMEIWKRHYISEKFEGWLKYILREKMIRESYIRMKTGIDMVFMMCGMLIVMALLSLIFEKVAHCSQTCK
ncbi:hypothetical protein Fcan01_00737 [Folsomia candida]|uniref:Uncharacterized protein n=1 Tax=Folsomia candida TaxID=158441 RepID=A0A226EZV2_FOLCA|nr:hypothetical protein Fcan01_00737 [Folsomia candida]